MPSHLLRAFLLRAPGWLAGGIVAALTAATPGHPAPLPAVRPAVELPPFLVEENRPQKPWRYASCPGMEVLSRCPDDVTRGLVGQYYRLHALLERILPAEFQGRSDVPVDYILYDAGSQGALASDLVGRLKSLAREREDGDYQVMPNFRLWDQDSMAIFFTVSAVPFERPSIDAGGLTLTRDYLHYLMASRAPTLPSWFIAGTLELYRTVELVAPTSRPVVPAWGELATRESESVLIDPFVWISPEETKRLRAKPETVPFLPLAEVLAPAPRGEDETGAALRATEAALFIRWALDPKKEEASLPLPDGTAPLPVRALATGALWEFVRRSAAGEPAVEACHASFGVDFAAVEVRLRAYRRPATGVFSGFRLRLDASEPPAVSLRDATPAEVGRIKGRLERLDIPYVRALAPEAVPRYLAQARGTLDRALQQNPGDPRLLAESGLCACDGGDDAAAYPALAAAAAAGVVHPRVYYELARIEIERATGAGTADSRLPEAAARGALGWLERGRAQAPLLWENVYLESRILALRPDLAGRGELATLRAGQAQFPRNATLAYAVGLVHAMAGDVARARMIVDSAAANVRDTEELARLRQLQEALASPAPQ